MRSKLVIGLAMLICMLTGMSSAAQETAPSEPPKTRRSARRLRG